MLVGHVRSEVGEVLGAARAFAHRGATTDTGRVAFVGACAVAFVLGVVACLIEPLTDVPQLVPQFLFLGAPHEMTLMAVRAVPRRMVVKLFSAPVLGYGERNPATAARHHGQRVSV